MLAQLYVVDILKFKYPVTISFKYLKNFFKNGIYKILIGPQLMKTNM